MKEEKNGQLCLKQTLNASQFYCFLDMITFMRVFFQNKSISNL